MQDELKHFACHVYKGYVTRQIYFYPKTGLYFRMCEDGADWHLIPRRISPRSEFFSRAHKNWHIMSGINLWPDWPPLARGSKFHTIHTPTKATSLPPLEQWKIWTSRFRRNNINYSSRQFWFPVWYFKGIYSKECCTCTNSISKGKQKRYIHTCRNN